MCTLLNAASNLRVLSLQQINIAFRQHIGYQSSEMDAHWRARQSRHPPNVFDAVRLAAREEPTILSFDFLPDRGATATSAKGIARLCDEVFLREKNSKNEQKSNPQSDVNCSLR